MSTTTQLPTPSVMTVNGKTYRLKPLGLGDLLELAKLHRDALITEAKRQMVGLPLELAKYAWDEANKKADKIQVGSLECKLANLSFEGMMYGLWLSLRGEQPQTTLEEVKAIFEANVNEATDRATEAMGYLSPNPTQPPTKTGE